MTTLDQRVEQKIKLYESRLQHIDELFEKAEQTPKIAASNEFAQLKNKRQQLSGHIEAIKQGDITEFEEDLIAQTGPMGIWDALALDLEKLIEQAAE